MNQIVSRGLAAAMALAVAASCSAGCTQWRHRKQAQTQLLSAQTLYRKGLEALGARELRKARDYLERIQFTPETQGELEPLVRLAIADATFYAGDDLSLIEARSKYLDFVTLYSDHPQAPYAQFQAGTASLKQVNDPSRDQSETQVAIADLEEVDRRWPGSPFASAARRAVARAQDNLARHELLVGQFYFKRKNYLAATERLRQVLTRYPQFGAKADVYLLLGQALVLGNNTAEGRIYLDKLVEDYPQSEAAQEARKFLAELPAPKEPAEWNSAPDGSERSQT